MKKILLSVIFIGLACFSFAQGTFVPLGSDAYTYIDRIDIKYSHILPIAHTTQKPYYRSKAAAIAETLLLSNLRFTRVQKQQLQFLIDDNAEWLDTLTSFNPRPLWKLYREPASFAHVTSKNKGLFDLRINPMLELHLGDESFQNRFLFTRAAGLEVRGNIKRVFSFYFNVTGNSARMPYYATFKTQLNPPYYAYVPGEAYWKQYSSNIFGFKDGVDYFDARGYVNVNVLKYINIAIGRDKFFIGNGERSLFLSDNSAPFYFLKFDLDIWRFKYENIFAELTSQYYRGGDQLLPKKYMALHHLSMQATHWLNFGLFESVIMNRGNNFELQYLNPIIFYRAVEHALGSPDNELIGADFKANAFNHMSVYGQLLLDEFNFGHFFKHDGWWGNKWGVQLGVKYIDILPNLDGEIEFNLVRPFTYSHDSTSNYSNYNQPLAHPLGANFYELIFGLRYQPIPRLSFTAKFFIARIGDDTSSTVQGAGITSIYSDFGSNILKPSNEVATSNLTGYGVGNGAPGNLSIIQLVVSYQPWHNMYVDAEIMYRTRRTYRTDISSSNQTENGSSFIFSIGGRINIPYKSHYF